MNVGSEFQDLTPVQATSLASMKLTIADCERLGQSRIEKLDKDGSEWSKYSKRWGILRRMVMWLHSWRFVNMADVLGVDADWLRGIFLEILAGKRQSALLRTEEGWDTVRPESD